MWCAYDITPGYQVFWAFACRHMRPNGPRTKVSENIAAFLCWWSIWFQGRSWWNLEPLFPPPASTNTMVMGGKDKDLDETFQRRLLHYQPHHALESSTHSRLPVLFSQEIAALWNCKMFSMKRQFWFGGWQLACFDKRSFLFPHLFHTLHKCTWPFQAFVH